MGATYRIDGDSSGAVRAVQDLSKAFDKAEKGASATTREAERLAKAAQRIKEAIDPQEKLNRLTKELAEHVKAGRLTIEQATQAHMKYRQELGLGVQEVRKAGQENEKSFGQQFITKLAGVAAGYVSIQAAIAGVTRVLREKEQLEQAAADRAFRARAGLGSLSQLAAAEANPRAAFRSLLSEARGFVTIGAAADDNEAGALLFELASAGLGRRDRAFAAQVRAAGTLQNVGGAAAAYDALRTALGGKEVGSFREFLGKALIAAGPAPGSFEQLPIAAAGAGGSARFLGINDEFLLAATTILGKQSGSIDVGGTQMAALLRQVEKSGLRGIEGIGGVELLDRLIALPERQQGFGGVLGDRAEAVSALRTLRENRSELMNLYKQIIAGQQSDRAAVAARLPETDEQLGAAIAFGRAKGAAEQTEQFLFATHENLFEAARANRRRLIAEQSGGFAAALFSGVSGIYDLNIFGSQRRFLEEELALHKESGGTRFSDPTLAAKIEFHLRSISGQQRAKATTRQE